jgi:hypothetical protein
MSSIGLVVWSLDLPNFIFCLSFLQFQCSSLAGFLPISRSHQAPSYLRIFTNLCKWCPFNLWLFPSHILHPISTHMSVPNLKATSLERFSLNSKHLWAHLIVLMVSCGFLSDHLLSGITSNFMINQSYFKLYNYGKACVFCLPFHI